MDSSLAKAGHMEAAPNEDAVLKAFAAEHSHDQFSINRSASLGAAGVCVAIALTMVQTQLRTNDAVASIICSCIAIPLFLLSAFINEYFLFLGEKSYGFYEHVRVPLRLINASAGGLLLISFAYASHSVSSYAFYVVLVASVAAAVGFGRFHRKLESWLAKQAIGRLEP
ncbi:hypothetical protein CTP10_R66420 (plasmid) [Cupriavidus sp. P-10]|uniref:hypothetical protein n=1 Tax=Cupriavidus sp. P-10 TaxID=2027911 RepID=UPI000E2E7A70|nr:hypothetical protein [Cupriavidus sp. P-10]BDB29229.1 hypothetical protein CTP10_R66420 [Cupriavidus sp. P-10]